MGKISLAALDIIVIVAYLAIVVGKGYLLSRKQEDVETYLLAGRQMSYWVVAISIIASLLSAITYLGAPTETWLHDMKFSLTLVTIVAITPVMIYLFLPFFYRLNVYTAYQYLEERFHISVRIVASIFFILWRLGWMALVVYAPSLAVSTLFNIDLRICILAVGLSSTLYTFMGGLTAVIWTDVMQFFVLYGGAAVIMAVAVQQTAGGLGYMWNAAWDNAKLVMFDWSWDPHQRLTTWSVLIGGFFVNLAQYGTDQVAIQRYLSSKSKDEARKSLIFHACIIVPVGMLFYIVGVMIWAFYHQNPGLLANFDTTHADRILAFFIAQQLPVGVRGLLVAALFAATMSSIDSGINSIATTTLIDFYQGWLKRELTEKRQLLLAKVWTLFWGLVATGAAIAASVWGSTLVEMSNKIAGLFSGALLGIFLLGMLTKRANWQGALLGSVVGFACALFAAFGNTIAGWLGPANPIKGMALSAGSISFMYYAVISCGVTWVAGYATSRFFAPPRPEQTAPPEELGAEKEEAPDELMP